MEQFFLNKPLIWLQVAVQTMGIHMCFCGNIGHRHQYRPCLYQDHWQRDCVALNMASGGYTCHSQRYGILRYQNLRTSPRHPAVPQTAHVHIGFRLLCAGTATWMTNTNMVLGAIMDYSGPLRMSHLKQNFPHLLSLLLPRPWGLPWSHGRFGAWVCVCLSCRLLYTMQPTLLGINNKTISANLSAVTAITSPVPPTSLHSPCAAPVV